MIRVKIFVPLYFILYTLYFPNPASAEFKIGDKFGFGNITSLGDVINPLVAPAFSIAATIVVIYFLLGAFKYLSSGGDKEAIAGARNMIIHAIIGFIILMFAFLILQFLQFSLFGITNFPIT